MYVPPNPASPGPKHNLLWGFPPVCKTIKDNDLTFTLGYPLSQMYAGRGSTEHDLQKLESVHSAEDEWYEKVGLVFNCDRVYCSPLCITCTLPG
jgi:hypothetical protein